MSTEKTHNDIKVKTVYVSGSQLYYVHGRYAKGETPKLSGDAIQMPKGLDTICGPNCELLKGQGSCKTHGGAGKLSVSFSGSTAPMVSYVVSQIGVSVDKTMNQLWTLNTQQVTSRSVGNILYLPSLDDMEWDRTDWEHKNNPINNLHAHVWNVLRQPPSKSSQLEKVAAHNHERAKKLFEDLVKKMTPADVKSAQYKQGIDVFSNRNNFLASLMGAVNTYQGYSALQPAQTAFIHSTILKMGQRQFPDDVAKILDCYKKVELAKAHEDVPFTYDEATVKRVMLSGLYKKPVEKPKVDLANAVALPF